jgi:hypothetical protein
LNGLAPAASASNCRPRISIRVASVETLRLLREGIHRLLYLPIMDLVQDSADDLLDPHLHLPDNALLLVGGSIPPGVTGCCRRFSPSTGATGESLGSPRQSWTAAVALDWLAG